SAIVLVPHGAPAEVANQLWIGGTQENNLSKGLFKRSGFFARLPGAGLFPWVTFRPFPTGGVNRDVYKASFHDITRFGIYKLDASDGHVVGKLDIDEANNATDIELSPDGTTAYVVDLMFNSYHVFDTRKGQGADVTTLFAPPSAFGPGGAAPIEPASGLPDNLRCIKSDFTRRCGTNNDCPASTGFCNHPGGAACLQDADCSNPPCVRGADCVPLVLGPPVASIQGKCSLTTSQRCSVNGDCPLGETCNDLVADPTVDPVPAAVLDGKILFNTAARDASVTNGVGLAAAAPRFDDAALTGKVPGSVVSTSHDASYVTCSTCHADFGGQDGRTWDFSQFGASLRNTMDLRGRPGFSPGTC